ncbi:MAG: hypothetical protein H6579_03135 [Chitinophagales bacterium]|nr:hypothetical protein [Chitinophagales bacterium]
MSETLAKIITYLFHPLLVPVYMAFVIIYGHPQFFTDTSQIHNEVRLMYFTAIMLVFPLVSILLMWRLEILSSLEPADNKEKFIPLIAVGTFWLWAYYMFKEDGLYLTSSYFALGNMILGCIIALFIMFPLNFTSNTSWHMVGAGGFISMLLNILRTSQYNLTIILLLVIIATGLVASAQLSLKQYNKNGLMAGFLIGFFGQFLAFQIWDKF